MKQLNHKRLKSAKQRALKEANKLCRGKSERERHDMFVRLWELYLSTEIRGTT